MRMIVTMLLACAICTTGLGAEYKAGSIEIKDPWSRATPKGASTAVGYMTVKNNGAVPDRLTGGTVDVADGVELHSMVMETGVAKMRELHDIEIKPGETIEFKPGSSHAMFVGLTRPLSKGERVSGTLQFQHAGRVNIEYEVGGICDQRAPMQMDHIQHTK